MNAISPIAAAEPPLADSLLNFVARAMTDPGINVDKLEALLRMQCDIVAKDARLRFCRAMSACQADMQPVLRDALNSQTRSRYATLEAIDAAIRPVYTRHGFSLEFNSEPGDGANTVIVCEVSHDAGHSKFFRLEAAPDTTGPNGNANKTPLHGLGSTVSYLRRYLTCMVFNVTLTNDDTDGNKPAPRAPTLTGVQIAELNALMTATRTLESRFLAAMAPDLRTIEQAPAADFGRLKTALVAKRTAMTKHEQQAAAERAARNRQTGAAA